MSVPTLEQSKAQIDALTNLMALYMKHARELQLQIGKVLEAAGAVHGLAAFPLVKDAIRKMRAAALESLPVESPFTM